MGSTYWSAASYAAPGLLQTANYGNGVQIQAAFNSRLALTSLSYQSTSPAPAQTFFSKTYQWDKNASNLIGESNLINSQQRQFGYDKLNRLVSAVDMTTTAAHATGTATVSGVEGSTTSCGGGGLSTQSASKISLPCTTIWDTGSVYLTVGAYSVSTPYGKSSTSAKLASSLTALLNASGSPVTATVSGATITLTSIGQGTSANYALSYSSDGDFNVAFSGATMTGGTSGQPIQGAMNQQYTLDAWGNLSSMGSAGFNQTINAHNQVSSFAYDAAGRLLSDSITSYTYDDDGMLKTSSDGTSYVYDALGARAQVAAGGASKEYYYFAGQLIATLNPTTGAWTDMIYAGGQKIADVAGSQAAVPIYTLPDHLGSEVASANSNDTAAATLDYTPFGQVFSGTSTDNFIFTGLERDSDGLDHAGFRMYSSGTGRWTTPDPYSGSMQFGNPQSFNRYVYVGNNSLTFTDPLGLTTGCSSITFLGVTYTPSCHDFGDGAEGLLATVALDAITLGLHELWRPQFHGNLNGQQQRQNQRSAPSKQPKPCFSVSNKNQFSFGTTFSVGSVNPFTSGSGKVKGYNPQTFGGATNAYTYTGSGAGLDVGVSVQAVGAWGSGDWGGPFRSVNFSIGPFAGSIFWSPGKGGWTGASWGLGAGSPGLAYEETNYTCREGK